MEIGKKSWEKPAILTLNGSDVESGVVGAPEGSHVTGTFSGSWTMGRPS
jgi:hypothetical protein